MEASGKYQNTATEAQEHDHSTASQNFFLKWLRENDEVLTAASTFVLEAAKNCKSKKGEVLAVLTAVGTFVSAVGSIAVATQAYSIANQAKVTAVLSFQEKRIQEEPLVESFKKVNEVIWEAKEKLRTLDQEKYKEYIIGLVEANKELQSLDQKGHKDYTIESVELDNRGIEQDIQLAFSFYEGVANCVKQGACDREAALAIFEENVEEFTVVFAPYFCNVAKETRDYTITQGLETFYKPNYGGLNEQTCSTYTAFNP